MLLFKTIPIKNKKKLLTNKDIDNNIKKSVENVP